MLAELQRLNETWNRAWLEKDAATVERLMATPSCALVSRPRTSDGPTARCSTARQSCTSSVRRAIGWPGARAQRSS
jgi:hypothetical protein